MSGALGFKTNCLEGGNILMNHYPTNENVSVCRRDQIRDCIKFYTTQQSHSRLQSNISADS